jgi:hypothetical protein
VTKSRRKAWCIAGLLSLLANDLVSVMDLGITSMVVTDLQMLDCSVSSNPRVLPRLALVLHFLAHFIRIVPLIAIRVVVGCSLRDACWQPRSYRRPRKRR